MASTRGNAEAQPWEPGSSPGGSMTGASVVDGNPQQLPGAICSHRAGGTLWGTPQQGTLWASVLAISSQLEETMKRKREQSQTELRLEALRSELHRLYTQGQQQTERAQELVDRITELQEGLPWVRT